MGSNTKRKCIPMCSIQCNCAPYRPRRNALAAINACIHSQALCILRIPETKGIDTGPFGREFARLFTAVIAQLVRAQDCGSWGRGFESRWPPHSGIRGAIFLISAGRETFIPKRLSGILHSTLMAPRTLLPLALSLSALAFASCLHVKLEPIQVHAVVDVNVKVDRALTDFFGDLDRKSTVINPSVSDLPPSS